MLFTDITYMYMLHLYTLIDSHCAQSKSSLVFALSFFSATRTQFRQTTADSYGFRCECVFKCFQLRGMWQSAKSRATVYFIKGNSVRSQICAISL